MRFLADMNISPVTVAALRNAGHEASRVSDYLPRNAPDGAILDWARRNDAIVITQDLDFSALLALGGQAKPSVISLRITSADPLTVGQRLLSLIPRYESDLMRGCAIAVEDDGCRVRDLPIR